MLQVTSVDVHGGELNVIVKYFGLGNAGGNIGIPVLIVAIKDMDPNVFFTKKVTGLTNTCEAGSGGYLYFCRSKCGNAALWRHWFSYICIPTIANAAMVHDLRDVNGNPHRSFLDTDGEATILNEAFDVDVMNQFQANRIDYLKLGPSATKTQQPWDAGNQFRSTKTGLSSTIRNNTNVEDELLRRNLLKYYVEFDTEYPTIKLTAKFREKITYSLMLIVHCLKKFILPDKMKASFISTGHHIENEVKEGEDSVNCELMMSLCLDSTITVHERQHMFECKEAAAVYGMVHGQITDEYMDSIQLYNTPNTVNRDELQAECRKYAFLVTHRDTNQRHYDYQQLKAHRQREQQLRTDPNNIIAVAAQKAQDKQRAKDTADHEKAAAGARRKAAKEATKQQETLRFEGLTMEQKAQERTAKKVAGLEIKRLREEMKVRQTAERNARLNMTVDVD